MNDWQLDNYQQMKTYRVIIAITVLAMVGLVGYNILFEGPKMMKSWAIWIPMLFVILQMFVFNPQFIAVGIKNKTLLIRTRDIMGSKKSTHLDIPLANLKSSHLKKTNSLFRGKLIIEYEQDRKTQAIELSLNNFTLVKREQLVKQLEALSAST